MKKITRRYNKKGLSLKIMRSDAVQEKRVPRINK